MALDLSPSGIRSFLARHPMPPHTTKLPAAGPPDSGAGSGSGSGSQSSRSHAHSSVGGPPSHLVSRRRSQAGVAPHAPASYQSTWDKGEWFDYTAERRRHRTKQLLQLLNAPHDLLSATPSGAIGPTASHGGASHRAHAAVYSSATAPPPTSPATRAALQALERKETTASGKASSAALSFGSAVPSAEPFVAPLPLRKHIRAPPAAATGFARFTIVPDAPPPEPAAAPVAGVVGPRIRPNRTTAPPRFAPAPPAPPAVAVSSAPAALFEPLSFSAAAHVPAHAASASAAPVPAVARPAEQPRSLSALSERDGAHVADADADGDDPWQTAARDLVRGFAAAATAEPNTAGVAEEGGSLDAAERPASGPASTATTAAERNSGLQPSRTPLTLVAAAGAWRAVVPMEVACQSATIRVMLLGGNTAFATATTTTTGGAGGVASGFREAVERRVELPTIGAVVLRDVVHVLFAAHLHVATAYRPRLLLLGSAAASAATAVPTCTCGCNSSAGSTTPAAAAADLQSVGGIGAYLCHVLLAAHYLDLPQLIGRAAYYLALQFTALTSFEPLPDDLVAAVVPSLSAVNLFRAERMLCTERRVRSAAITVVPPASASAADGWTPLEVAVRRAWAAVWARLATAARTTAVSTRAASAVDAVWSPAPLPSAFGSAAAPLRARARKSVPPPSGDVAAGTAVTPDVARRLTLQVLLERAVTSYAPSAPTTAAAGATSTAPFSDVKLLTASQVVAPPSALVLSATSKPQAVGSVTPVATTGESAAERSRARAKRLQVLQALQTMAPFVRSFRVRPSAVVSDAATTLTADAETPTAAPAPNAADPAQERTRVGARWTTDPAVCSAAVSALRHVTDFDCTGAGVSRHTPAGSPASTVSGGTALAMALRALAIGPPPSPVDGTGAGAPSSRGIHALTLRCTGMTAESLRVILQAVIPAALPADSPSELNTPSDAELLADRHPTIKSVAPLMAHSESNAAGSVTVHPSFALTDDHNSTAATAPTSPYAPLRGRRPPQPLRVVTSVTGTATVRPQPTPDAVYATAPAAPRALQLGALSRLIAQAPSQHSQSQPPAPPSSARAAAAAAAVADAVRSVHSRHRKYRPSTSAGVVSTDRKAHGASADELDSSALDAWLTRGRVALSLADNPALGDPVLALLASHTLAANVSAVRWLDVSQNELGTRGAQLLADSLRSGGRYCALTHLNASACSFGAVGMTVLCQSLAAVTASPLSSLCHVDVSDNIAADTSVLLDDTPADATAAYLTLSSGTGAAGDVHASRTPGAATSSSATAVDPAPIMLDAGAAIASLLQQTRTITCLRVARNRLTGAAAAMIATAVAATTTITALDVSGIDFRGCARVLAHAVQRASRDAHSALEHVSVADQRFDARALCDFAAILPHNARLRTLDLSCAPDTAISGEEVAAAPYGVDSYTAAMFGAALPHNQSLTCLNLRAAPPSVTAGGSSTARTHLTSAVASALRMHSEGCVALMRGCVGHPALTSLDLSYHGIRNAGALAVVTALQPGVGVAGAGPGANPGGCPALRYVWMRGNHITARGAVTLAAELAKLHAAWSTASRTVARRLWLDLSGNPLQADGRTALRAVSDTALLPGALTVARFELVLDGTDDG